MCFYGFHVRRCSPPSFSYGSANIALALPSSVSVGLTWQWLRLLLYLQERRISFLILCGLLLSLSSFPLRYLRLLALLSRATSASFSSAALCREPCQHKTAVSPHLTPRTRSYFRSPTPIEEERADREQNGQTRNAHPQLPLASHIVVAPPPDTRKHTICPLYTNLLLSPRAQLQKRLGRLHLGHHYAHPQPDIKRILLHPRHRRCAVLYIVHCCCAVCRRVQETTCRSRHVHIDQRV